MGMGEKIVKPDAMSSCDAKIYLPANYRQVGERRLRILYQKPT
jgi:hypothetical protein